MNELACNGEYSFNQSSLDMLETIPLRDERDNYDYI
eukprot:CAMPEP_0198134214 /NCGR_PEP_ID=MMETSP1442-20131203/59965_1 /TAXON_ID= /ORGANISM="Craspedostauros australis, Strain CCMP3328" /LENGTH=35 /DNA_ID= /DNA_START= /DNA_END= /DNA_ORIENTATION=